MESLARELKTLQKGEKREIYRSPDGTVVFVYKREKPNPRMKREPGKYDFAVGLRKPDGWEFFPTHIRLFFDLYLKRLSNPNDSQKLFRMIKIIFDGEHFSKYVEEANKLKFTMQLDSADVNLVYTQLLMIEQDFNYGPEGNKETGFEPPRAFFMSFIEWIASGEKNIDRIIYSAIRGTPPSEFAQKYRKNKRNTQKP